MPFGLACTALLGRIAGHPAPLREAGIAILSAAMGRDLAAETDLLPALDLAGLSPEALDRPCRAGAGGWSRGPSGAGGLTGLAW